jgi:adenylate cyclase
MRAIFSRSFSGLTAGRSPPVIGQGGGKLEFTLIGDTVNIAARVEQLTKTTGDAILLTGQSVEALASRPTALTDRGFHVLKGKSAAVQVFGLDPRADAISG